MSKWVLSTIGIAGTIVAVAFGAQVKVSADAAYGAPSYMMKYMCFGNASATYFLCHGYDSVLNQHNVRWTGTLYSKNCTPGWTSSKDVYDPARQGGRVDCQWYGNRKGIHANQWGPGDEGNYLLVQEDGNVVLYDGNHNAIWATNTWGYPGAYLALQEDNNMVVYYGSTPLWSLR